MKEPLFFHIQPKREEVTVTFKDGTVDVAETEEDFQPHTYCICKGSDEDENTLFVGYAVAHKKDHFDKKKGRDLASNRMSLAIECNLTGTIKSGETRIHDSVKQTIDKVVERAAFLLDMKGPVKYITRTDHKGKKIFSVFNLID
jgi:D-serine dehydratase